jgi:hypothetical protein
MIEEGTKKEKAGMLEVDSDAGEPQRQGVLKCVQSPKFWGSASVRVRAINMSSELLSREQCLCVLYMCFLERGLDFLCGWGGEERSI